MGYAVVCRLKVKSEMSLPAHAAAAGPTRLPRFNRMQDAACVAFLLLLALAAWLPLLTKNPTPGGDEPGFVDPAATFARQGFLGTSLYLGQLPGMERHVYWQPPIYFVSLGLWFKAFGVGLVQARLFSVLCGLVIVVCVYRLARLWASPRQSLGVSALCALSVWVGEGARVARMDALCAAFVLLCAAYYLQALRRTARPAAYSLAGVLAGLALLTHPLGIVAIVAVLLHMAWRRRRGAEFAAVLAPLFLCLLGWLAYIGQDVGAFRAQMEAQAARRALYVEPPFWFWFFTSKLHMWTLAILLGSGAWAAAQRRQFRDGDFVVLLAFVALTAATYGRLSFYFLSFVPLFCITLALCLQSTAAKRWAGWGLALALGIELAGLARTIRHARSVDYSAVAASLRAAVPPRQSVFLSYSYLSPYFALAGRNPLRVTAPVPLPPGYSLDRVVAGCDYLAVPSPLIDTSLRHWIMGKQPVVSVAGGALAIYRLPERVPERRAAAPRHLP